MRQQASYVLTEQGETFAVVFEGDTIIAAVEVPDPDPALLLGYIEEGAEMSDPLVIARLNRGFLFGGVTEIQHAGYVWV